MLQGEVFTDVKIVLRAEAPLQILSSIFGRSRRILIGSLAKASPPRPKETV